MASEAEKLTIISIGDASLVTRAGASVEGDP